MRIGVLTGGGDAPGLNAAIRAIVKKSEKYGYEVIGIRRGWAGLLNLDTMDLKYKDIKDVVMKVTVKGIGSGSSYIGEIEEDDIGRASVTIRVPVNAVPRIYPVVVEFTGKVDGDYFRLRRVRYIKVR